MTADTWVPILAAILALTAVFALIDYRIADDLRAAREERDAARLEADRQTVLAETWHAIAEGRDALAEAERGAR